MIDRKCLCIYKKMFMYKNVQYIWYSKIYIMFKTKY